ncbi:probable serine/threonine-protein kinase SIS8 isoform X1 [Typha angustifolia]|uniref:probable serine/threonine-protein kinase SIS8 isoform X1 n=2 Tax=Typha angustifolia TaxID=59011 RepID=UPI003C2B6053
MKNLLKKLHIVPSQQDDADDPQPSSPSKKTLGSIQDQKPLSTLSNWLNSIGSKHGSSSPPPTEGTEMREDSPVEAADSAARRRRMREVEEEEYQIQLALEMSAREDPEAAQIEVAKQISLGSCPPDSTGAEVVAYRYWNYNALGYDDKIVDGFYDIYGIWDEPTSVKMPSLIDLQGKPLSDNVSWEAVLVNRTDDSDILKLEQKASIMALASRSESSDLVAGVLVQRLAFLVANYMGGEVCDPESMLLSYQNLSSYLRVSTGNMVLPLGRLTIGLARHRALLFKVLADSVSIPCRLLKGKQYTGSDDGALSIVKLTDGREYIVDLMADPGTLIPSEGAGLLREYEENFYLVNQLSKDVESLHMGSSISGVSSSGCCSFESEPIYSNPVTTDAGVYTMSSSSYQENPRLTSLSQKTSTDMYINSNPTSIDESRKVDINVTSKSQEKSLPVNRPFIARSPSWTEGINSRAVRRMKVKDVSQYMINAAKENPQLAQKLHDVLLESGVVAPPDLFSEMCEEESKDEIVVVTTSYGDKDEMGRKNDLAPKNLVGKAHEPFFPDQIGHSAQQKFVSSRLQLDPLKPVEGLGFYHPVNFQEATGNTQSEASAAQVKEASMQIIKHGPVTAAAAVATAAIVASSMVVAAAKANTDINFEVPIAAAVAATTAAVSKQYEQLESYGPLPVVSGCLEGVDSSHSTNKILEDLSVTQKRESDHGYDGGLEQEKDVSESPQEVERNSDKSTGTESAKSDIALDDVAEFEIPWEDIVLGERIGLGSFGEVYKGDWHGTEVAVKKFLHQDISSDALEEFRSEVRIMRRLRHPNVVLFMGAVTRVPHLSIVTEFLPRGSLFRLIHRPNNQLDERRRLRMALDVARGMNYLHNCTPVIVHRDLKSPNLLVDKNWVVKVCDFGLSRIKHNTFLSSRSTAGTAEWMAPEVLRNEPSDEKCDVYSYGIILWELSTLQQPWDGMNPMQVVGAVGFQHRRLDIPDDMNSVIADIIKACWQTDPKMRPSFSEIMAALKLLLKTMGNNQVQRQNVAPPGNLRKCDS